MNKIAYYVKLGLGWAIAHIRPARTDWIRANLSAPYWGQVKKPGLLAQKADEFTRFYLAHADNVGADGQQLEHYHQGFWRSKLDTDWYQRTANKFESTSLPLLEPLLGKLDDIVVRSGATTLCEIGTGDGKLIACLQRRFTGSQKFIGLDLSAERMTLNNQTYEGIEFYGCDAGDWIKNNSTDRTIYITNGGVFEYFSQKSLESLLVCIAQNQPHSALAVFFEPIAEDHDLEKERHSQLTSAGEFSFSHNYPYLFEASGYRVEYCEIDTRPGYRSASVIATVK